MSGPGVALTTPALPTPDWTGGEMAKGICSVEGCERPRLSRGWCSIHYLRWRAHGDPLTTKNYKGEFWDAVDKNGPIPDYAPHLGRCWLWTAARGRKGYGLFRQDLTHRWSYREMVGPIPEGLVLDHLCRVRLCVNPTHLEPVTTRENFVRGPDVNWNRNKTHCIAGHPFDEANTYVRKDGGRQCRACGRVKNRQRRGKSQ